MSMKIRDKMEALKLILMLCGIALVPGNAYDIHLDAAAAEAVHGQPFTLRCSVNKSVSFSSVTWQRKAENVVASTIYGEDKPFGDLQSPYGNIFGHYYVTLYGPYKHHLTLLTDSHKDEGSKWKCLAGGYESELITIHTRQPCPPSFWNMAWVYGLTTGITFGVLILTLAVYYKCSKRT